MMAKTHVSMGIATSLVVFQPKNLSECIIAVIGGVLGGVAADIDTVRNDYQHDALIGQLLAVSITTILLALDLMLNLGVVRTTLNRDPVVLVVGMSMYIILYRIGYVSKHRTFTHSLLALFLFSLAFSIIFPMLMPAYIVGYLSHLGLDILNKKKVPLFYPTGEGFCLGWCYASKLANTLFMWAGCILSLVFIYNALGYHFF